MPLDPKARRFLDAQAALDLPPRQLMSIADARDLMRRQSAALNEPRPLSAVRDFSVATPGGRVPLRLYAPTTETRLPVLVYFHGGGWVLGDLETHDAICRSLAIDSGAVVLSVDYRRAPEHEYPAAVDDAYAVTRWVSANASELQGDPRRLAVAGDSAGGNLAAAVSLRARDEDGPPLCCQLLVYPVADHDFETASYAQCAEGYGLTRDTMMWFWDLYVPAAERRAEPYAAPLRAERLSGLPPALIITAEYDPLRDEGEALARRLESEGSRAKLTRYDGMIHGFFRQTDLYDQAPRALGEAALFLRRELDR